MPRTGATFAPGRALATWPDRSAKPAVDDPDFLAPPQAMVQVRTEVGRDRGSGRRSIAGAGKFPCVTKGSGVLDEIGKAGRQQ